MRRIKITILLLAIAGICNGQDYIKYYTSANEAEFQLSERNLSEAEHILIKLQSEYASLKPKDYFYLGIIEYLKDDSTKGYYYLSSCAYHFGRPTDHIANYKRMYPKLKIPDPAIGKLSQIETEQTKMCQKSIFDTLRYFSKQDQLNRKNHATLNLDEDVRIQTAFLNYLQANGIPDLVKYGDATLATIVLHLYNEKVFSRYKEYLYAELCKGNICPYMYSSMVDRHQYDYYKPTIYNSYFPEIVTDAKTLTEINENRKRIGLSEYFKGPNIRPIPDFYTGNFRIAKK